MRQVSPLFVAFVFVFSVIFPLHRAHSATPAEIQSLLKAKSKSVFVCYQPVVDAQKRICVSLNDVTRGNPARAFDMGGAMVDAIVKHVGTQTPISGIDAVLENRGIQIGCDISRFGIARTFVTRTPDIQLSAVTSMAATVSSSSPLRTATSRISLQPTDCGASTDNKSPSDSSGDDALIGTMGSIFDAEQDASQFSDSILSGAMACISEASRIVPRARRRTDVRRTLMDGSNQPTSPPAPPVPPAPPAPTPSTPVPDDTVEITFTDGRVYRVRDSSQPSSNSKVKKFVGNLWNRIIGGTGGSGSSGSSPGGTGSRADCIEQDSCPAAESCMSKASQDAFNAILIANSYDGCNINVMPAPGSSDACYKAKLVSNYDEGLTDELMKTICEFRGQVVDSVEHKCVVAPNQMQQNQNVCNDPRAMCLDSSGPPPERPGMSKFKSGELPVFSFDPMSVVGSN